MRFLIVLLLLFSASANADVLDEFECKPQGQLIVNTDALVAKVQSTYKAVSSLQAKFIQSSYLGSLDTSETSAGDVVFLKPGKMKWLYKAPEPQTFLVKDSTLWFYQPVEKQVTVDVLDKVLLSDLPVGFLMGLGDLAKEFSVKDACTAKSGILIRFIPQIAPDAPEGSEQLNSFTLLVSQDTYLPKGAEILDLSSNKTSIFLDKVTINQPISEAEFNTKFPAGTDITDRRSTHNQ